MRSAPLLLPALMTSYGNARHEVAKTALTQARVALI
jgi:hypothetical protein